MDDQRVRQAASADQDWLNAARLVRRSGFGATGTQVDAVVSSGAVAFLAAALTSDPSADKGIANAPGRSAGPRRVLR